jgi:protein-S-isoprenylcysteine O-methyltransferase Ste14
MPHSKRYSNTMERINAMLTGYIICAVFTFVAAAAIFLPYSIGELEIAFGVVLALAAALFWPVAWGWLGGAIIASHLKSL